MASYICVRVYSSYMNSCDFLVSQLNNAVINMQGCSVHGSHELPCNHVQVYCQLFGCQMKASFFVV